MTERKTLFADVVLPIAIHQVFTYRIPFELNEYVSAGIRVVVPFGKSKLLTLAKLFKTFSSFWAIGLLIFLASFYFPIISDFQNMNLLAHFLVISMAFLIEAFLTTQLGVAYTIIFILLFINRTKTSLHKELV